MQFVSHLSHATKVGVGSAAVGVSMLGAGWASGMFRTTLVHVPDKNLDGEEIELEEVYKGGQVGGSKQACDDAFDKVRPPARPPSIPSRCGAKEKINPV